MPDNVADAIVNGDYERAEVELLIDLVQPRARVLELGGGLGFVASSVCKTREVDRYTMVEADPDLVPLIERTLARNSVEGVDVRWGLIRGGAGHRAGETGTLAITENFLANSALLVGQGNRDIEVPVMMLGSLLGELTPNTLIVDVEGAEVDLFEQVDLSCVQTLVVELHPQLIDEAACAAVVSAIERQGLNAVHRPDDNVQAFKRMGARRR